MESGGTRRTRTRMLSACCAASTRGWRGELVGQPDRRGPGLGSSSSTCSGILDGADSPRGVPQYTRRPAACGCGCGAQWGALPRPVPCAGWGSATPRLRCGTGMSRCAPRPPGATATSPPSPTPSPAEWRRAGQGRGRGPTGAAWAGRSGMGAGGEEHSLSAHASQQAPKQGDGSEGGLASAPLRRRWWGGAGGRSCPTMPSSTGPAASCGRVGGPVPASWQRAGRGGAGRPGPGGGRSSLISLCQPQEQSLICIRGRPVLQGPVAALARAGSAQPTAIGASQPSAARPALAPRRPPHAAAGAAGVRQERAAAHAGGAHAQAARRQGGRVGLCGGPGPKRVGLCGGPGPKRVGLCGAGPGAGWG